MPSKTKKPLEGKLIGNITHYFPKVKAAVVKLKAPVKIGDSIRVMGGENTNFTQVVNSMEIDHKKIKRAKKGDEIGLKLNKKVREGYKIYKI
jgi:putative protease